MNSAVRIIKRGKNEILTEGQANQDKKVGRQGTREIASVVKGWIAELHQRRRDEELTASAFRKIGIVLSLVTLSFWGLRTESYGQQLRDTFRKVEQAVVIVRTQQKEVAPFPQEGMVSLNGLGSGVLISNDGKVLTAAHLVQAADNTVVEFTDGELIPAHVTGSATYADVALLQLERTPVNIVAATLGDSDKVEVGDQIFVVGAPYGISNTLTAGHVSGRHSLDKRTENTTAVEFLQTDAAINRGNSGSPVFSLDGEIMGIISNIMSRSGGSEGLAFAATSNTARRLLLEQKPFWSGIEGFLVDGDLARALNLPQPAGVLVQRVAEGSIAWRWGIHSGTLRASVEGQELLLGGDIILGVNEIPVEKGGDSYDEIYASISKLKPVDNLVIRLFRQGQIVKLSIPTTQ
jgi:S1-C subfamily serine protease